jgi:hypothetical protein
MPAKKFLPICPACGSEDTTECDWSGEIGEPPQDYEGPWIECKGCGMRGPKIVCKMLMRRRSDFEKALGLENLSAHDRAYMLAIERFGQRMFCELKANDARKGNFLDWKPGTNDAPSELGHHYHKLVIAIQKGKKHRISEFSADMANVVMAIALTQGIE